MSRIKLSTDNLNIFFPKNKKYNPYVGWIEMNVYFRFKNRMQKRRLLVISKTTATNDYNNFIKMKSQYNMGEDERKQQESWLLCRKKSLEEFKKNNKTIIRHVYDIPEVGDRIHQDSLYMDNLMDDGQKPYASEIVVPDESINIKILIDSARYYLRTCFDLDVKLKDIKFISRMNKKEINNEWREYKKQRDRMGELRKKGIRPNIVFKENAAKYLFGDNVKEFKIEGSKRTITFNDGTQRTEVQRNFKILGNETKIVKPKMEI